MTQVDTPRDRWSLDGKTILITGGSRGIGRAIAEEYLRHGGSVFITARTPEVLEEAQAHLSQFGPVASLVAPSEDPAMIEESVAKCIERFGSLDVLVNNAARGLPRQLLIDTDLDDIQKVWNVNLSGALLYARHAWHGWMKEHGGSIINVASVTGVSPTPMAGAYNLSKATLIHLSRQLSLELAPAVRVNTLVPGLVRTRMTESQTDAEDNDLLARFPLGRLGTTEDLAGAALLLATDAGAWITGQTYIVDGGSLQAWWPLNRTTDDPVASGS